MILSKNNEEEKIKKDQLFKNLWKNPYYEIN